MGPTGRCGRTVSMPTIADRDKVGGLWRMDTRQPIEIQRPIICTVVMRCRVAE